MHLIIALGCMKQNLAGLKEEAENPQLQWNITTVIDETSKVKTSAGLLKINDIIEQSNIININRKTLPDNSRKHLFQMHK